MWVVRILSGPQAGQIFPLNEGTNTIGRAPSCNIKVLNAGVSKEHAKIDALHDKVILHDMGSRNGTFINGVQIKSQLVQPGDKILLHDTMVEIANMPDQIRGYGPVKEKAVHEAEEKTAELLRSFAASADRSKVA